MNFKHIFFTLLMLFSFQSSFCREVKIHGKITDEKKEALEFVTVGVSGTAIGTMSKADGSFYFSAPYNDTICVTFSCIGYVKVERKLIDADNDVTLNIVMQPTSTQLSEVEITDFKKQTDQMQTISSEAGKLMPNVSGNGVEGMLTTLAGVSSSNEMSSQYSVRGGTFDENSVYINGVEVYRPQLVASGQQEGLSIINSDLVKSIAFSTGGFSAEYADKMSSVLDIAYREPESLEGSLSMSLMGGSLSFGQHAGKFSQLHGIRYKRNSSLLSSMDTKGEYDPSFFDYQTNLIYRPAQKWKISFLGNVAINNYKFVPASRTTNFGTSTDAKQFKVYFDGMEKDKFETWLGALSIDYVHSKSTGLSLIASGYITNELVAYDILGEYWLDQAGTTGTGSSGNAVGGELGVGRYHEHARNRLRMSVVSFGFKGYQGIGEHNITYGATLSFEKIKERSREYELRDSAGYTLPFNPNAIEMVYNLSSVHWLESKRLTGYVQDTYKLPLEAGLLSINGGVRMSYWGFNKEFLVSPRANVSFVPEKNSAWTMRFATGIYYQSPFYKEYRQPVVDAYGNINIHLNNDIKSQQSLHFIFGTDYTFRAYGRPFKLSGELYYKKLNDLIPYEINNLKVVYTGLNETSGYTAGLDMKLFGQFVPGSDSWISFSLMKTNENLNGVDVPRPTDRRYSFAMYFTDYFPKIPRLKFSLKAIFSDGLPTTAPHTTRDQGYFRAPAYKRLDIGLSYALLPELKEGEKRNGFWNCIKSAWLGLDVFNLLDISNVSGYYWVTDVNKIQYAVPNYLTRRQLNVRLTIDF